jgi:CubicO group peptidase (beta-lactamase class C family)
LAIEVKRTPKVKTAAVTVESDLQQALGKAVAEAAERLNVPGVAAGVVHGEAEHHAFYGITSIEHPLEVDESTLFQIGSTGKTFTATAIMRLVEAGKVSLDAPVRTYVPELKLKDENVAQSVTVLQLLNHTAGWDGDFFEDQGDGDDALKKYVRRMRTLTQVFPLGTGTSYNNAAVALAGRVIEKVTKKTYEKAMKELVFDPVELENCFFSPNDIMTRRFAVGHRNHEEDGEKKIDVERPWRMLRAANPMGGISANLGDTLKWAKFHMGDGTGKDGQRVLSRESLELMQTPTAKLPVTLGDSVGISWLISHVGPLRLVGHGGTTEGQLSAFQMIPDRHFAVVINTNSTNGAQVHRELQRWVLKEYLGVDEPEDQPLELSGDELQDYAGVFDTDSAILTITVVDDHLEIDAEPTALTLRLLKKMGRERPPKEPPIKAKILTGDQCIVIDGPAKGIKGQYERVSGVITGLNLSRLAVKRR